MGYHSEALVTFTCFQKQTKLLGIAVCVQTEITFSAQAKLEIYCELEQGDAVIYQILKVPNTLKLSLLRFILPCKSECHTIFGITQFVTQNTHVSRHFGAQNRKQNKKV